MKLVNVEIRPVNSETRVRILTLEAEQAQGRLMIAQLAIKLRKIRIELRDLKKGALYVENSKPS